MAYSLFGTNTGGAEEPSTPTSLFGTTEEAEQTAAPAAGEVAPDPLASVTPASTPVPGVDEIANATAQANTVQPNLDPLARNRVVKGINATARALAQPVTNPVGFLQGLNEQVKGVFVDPVVQAAKNPQDIGKQIDPRQLSGETAGFSMVPGYKTSFDVQTPEGREYLSEHPEQVALDVLGVLPSGALGKIPGKAASATAKAGEVVASKAPGLATRVAEAAGKVRELLPSSRTAEVGSALGTAERAATKEVATNVGTLLDDYRKADLSPEEIAELRSSLDHGVRPANERLAPFFDRFKEWSEADRARKLSREAPDPVREVVVDQVEAKLAPKMAKTGLGPEATAQMFDALRKGADNPIPEASKAWNQMRLEVNRRTLAKQRDAKLFEFDPGLAGVGPEVYPWREYSRLRSAKRMLERKLKVLDPELHPRALEGYRAIVEKFTPGRYEPLLQQQKAALALAENRRRFEPGFGRAAYDTMTKEATDTWVSLAEQGVEPVYIPRQALETLTEEAKTGRPTITTRTPGSMKATTGKGEYYETDPAAMMLKDEFEVANQHMVQSAIGEIYQRTGGKSYERALRDYMDQGYSQAQAERVIRSNYRSMRMDGTTFHPKPGELLVRRDVAASLKHYVEQTMPSLVDEVFGMWMVPTLWLSPRFHLNNILGGAVMVGLKSPGSLLDYLRYGREAWKQVREGAMDARIPFGAGQAPQYTRRFTRESMLEEGGRLASLWQKIPGHGVVDRSRRFNEFMDSLNRTVTYLSEYDRAAAKGVDPWTAREVAGKAAANLMQNWDSFSPIERILVQRVYPFWGFRKAMLRTILTYPIDHPVRMHFLYQLSRDQQERSDLPEEWDHLVGIGGEGKDGKRYYLSIKGLDPFADIADFFTFKGFLANLHPVGGVVTDVAGVDSFRGGIPYYPFGDEVPDIDPTTGKLRRPLRWDQLWSTIPQLGALARAAGLMNIPPPEEPTPEGLIRWYDEYGSMLGLGPSVSRKSEAKAMADYAENLKTRQRYLTKAQKEQAKTAGAVATAPQTTPAPTASPEPTGLTYDPWTGEYK